MNNTQTQIRLRPINHVAFVIDESGSMHRYRETVVRVFDDQVKTLAEQSVKLEQETRVSLYLFNGRKGITCIAYDCDVLRLPSLKGQYCPDGGTPLIRATLQSMMELGQTPELHADHAFLLYAITDGEETVDRISGHRNRRLLNERLSNLKENWTVCALVPDYKGVDFALRLGFHSGNIQQWDCTSAAGLNDASNAVKVATQSYMTMRASGIRSSKNLFTPSVSSSRADVVKQLKPVTDPYLVFKATGTGRESISSFVERATQKPYVIGSAFYELVKPETIQPHKKICLRTKPDGHLYSGNNDEIRKVLGLPVGGEIKVGPAELKDFQVFVESTSVNRHVIPNQDILVVKL